MLRPGTFLTGVARLLTFAKRRATDLKANSRVFFPKTARSWVNEANLQTLRISRVSVGRGGP